jgi:hypothetical protein
MEMYDNSRYTLSELTSMHFVRAERSLRVGTRSAGVKEMSFWSVVCSAVGEMVFGSFLGEDTRLVIGSDATSPFKRDIVDATLVQAVRRRSKDQLTI